MWVHRRSTASLTSAFASARLATVAAISRHHFRSLLSYLRPPSRMGTSASVHSTRIALHVRRSHIDFIESAARVESTPMNAVHLNLMGITALHHSQSVSSGP